jgi:hypothetical protein
VKVYTFRLPDEVEHRSLLTASDEELALMKAHVRDSRNETGQCTREEFIAQIEVIQTMRSLAL